MQNYQGRIKGGGEEEGAPPQIFNEYFKMRRQRDLQNKKFVIRPQLNSE